MIPLIFTSNYVREEDGLWREMKTKNNHCIPKIQNELQLLSQNEEDLHILGKKQMEVRLLWIEMI
jgi:hypothetical protein